jgi:ferredoxin-NADP reductase
MLSTNLWCKAHLDSIRPVASDVREFTFAVEHDLPAFEPGAHIRIKVTIAGTPAIRSYTVLPSPSGTLRIAVKQHEVSRGGSAYLWQMKEGDAAELSLPENRFALSWRNEPCLLIAGGIGITPIYGMAMALAQSGRTFRLLFGARSRDQMAFVDDLKAACGDNLALFAQDKGEMIPLEAEINALPPDGEVYMCGPLPMLTAVKAIWEKTGRPVSRLRFEVFGDSGLHAEQAFTVHLPAYGKSVHVPQDKSLLQALQDAGIPMIYDCQRGECGLCAVTLEQVNAPVDHRDVFFSAHEKAENRRMCTCVSRLVGGEAVIDTGYRADAAGKAQARMADAV